jgi:cellulose synthase/poly-beta-1,6-N-acetylglucosamine synthase-like glycosyltransferase
MDNFFLAFYFLQIFVLSLGALRGKFFKKSKNVKISVLVPAKDEEENIKECLLALKNQNFSTENYEILFLNDQSTDKTLEIVEEIFPEFENLAIFNVEKSENKNLQGKAGAIDFGIKKAKNDIVLICDADCRPNSHWLEEITGNFVDEVGVVSGFTLLDERMNKSGTMGAIQSMDWLILQGVGCGFAGINHPVSCIGSNMAFRKSAYFDVGGYANLPFSVTEDLLLYKTIAQKTKWKFRYLLTENGINFSLPVKKIKTYYEQRKRWLFGSLGLSNLGKFIVIYSIFAHIYFLATNLSGIFALGMINFLFFLFFIFSLKQKRLIKYFPIYALYFLITLIGFPFVYFFDNKVSWKNRSYSRKDLK